MSQKFIPLFYLSFMCIVLGAHEAMAGGVVNMTGQPQIIEIRTYQGYEPLTIPPYGHFSSMSPFHVRYHDHELYLRENMEYAIWPGDVFGPQRVYKRRRGF